MIKDLPIADLDYVVGAVLLISALLAFMRGFVHEILSIGAWAAAVAASIYGLPYARPYVQKVIHAAWAADAAAAVVIFLTVLLVCSLVTHVVSNKIQKSALNNVDRALGFLFGLARAVIVLAVGLMIVDWYYKPQPRPTWVQSAKTVRIIDEVATTIEKLVPSSLAPSAVAKEAQHTVKTAADAKKSFDELTKPATDVQPAKDREGYDDKARNDLERLLDATAAAKNGAAAPEAPEKK